MATDTPALDPGRDYPIGLHRPELLRTPTGRTLEDLTLENALGGQVTAEDLRITPETLGLQAQVAEAAGRPQLAENFRRAAELTAVPDERVLEIYAALRPNASTKDELLAIAAELEETYGASANAELVRDAAAVYERRDCLAD
ncbi:diol dehydratase small subunit [Patulibacter sp. SYSU D01012]|uniref:diol dehydratase small subunit n=1 Tax=Patulibacter sp. SYSU D01012 TaxID=2817381 RepID=UPI001FEEC127|nr:diol dehydratase small subunit [Patulibacter sp. SYSU D01012]